MTRTSNIKPRSVVYSFEGRWEEPLKKGLISVFFRKRRPVITPSRIFFYVGTPVKKIIGSAALRKIEPVNLEDAIRIKANGAITENELVSYIGQDGTVSAIWIEQPEVFSNPVGFMELKEKHKFNPPQSFSNVSPEFEKYLLEVAE